MSNQYKARRRRLTPSMPASYHARLSSGKMMAGVPGLVGRVRQAGTNMVFFCGERLPKAHVK